jgi:asparagine synthase (glutamine-hydrolysing)
MSVQFGRWNLDGEPVDNKYLQRVSSMIAPYGPDGGGSYKRENVGILYHAFHTSKESHQAVQPCVLKSTAVLTWDGRLDNRDSLMGQLPEKLPSHSPDVAIVAAAYEHWGTGCLAKLLGDWALAVWSVADRCLILAKDFVGTRHLYYSVEKEHVTWSTILDPLVLLAGHSFELEEEYIAGWLSFSPAPHLTPYAGIQSVPPSCFVRVEKGASGSERYWDFDARNKIRYRNDREYEEHFREVFANSVQRRIRSDKPVVAELSGGMDSSSIVCMADSIIARGLAATPRLDTVSYYDDSEPNWNERPYFSRVEQKRGRSGAHIDVSPQNSCSFEYDNRFAPLPDSHKNPSKAVRQFTEYLDSQGNRVLLSGVGGDEVLGGVPTPIPELADLLITMRIRVLARQMLTWALVKRTPLLHLIAEIGSPFLPARLQGVPKYKQPPIWLQSGFVKRQRLALQGYGTRLRFFGALPSFQENLKALDALRRQFATSTVSPRPLVEKCYPYLDRDLLEYLYAIPREQIVRPGQRRSLMRRALTGLVPDELLNRKRKAFVTRSTMIAVCSASSVLAGAGQSMVAGSLGILDPTVFTQELNKVRSGRDLPIAPIMRTMEIEFWLRYQILHSPLVGRFSLLVEDSIPASLRFPSRSKNSGNPDLLLND